MEPLNVLNLTADNAIEYANSRPELRGEHWKTARLLGGGVSNSVVLLGSPTPKLVLKQSLGRLRVEEEWLADQSRILRESAAMSQLAPLLPPGSVPRVAFTDAANFIYAMEAAPEDAIDWKTRMLKHGEASEQTARGTALILACLINATRNQPHWRTEFGDQHCFDQLRLDPYYRFTASRHPDLAARFQAAIESCRTNACALVHGDFSPKNILVTAAVPHQPVLIDFEVIHYGDPAFDAAFLLNHLLLKHAHGVATARRLALVFWRTLQSNLAPAPALEAFEQSTILHLGCLHLARVDGKSPAEYLTPDERRHVRDAARRLILHPPRTIEEIFAE